MYTAQFDKYTKKTDVTLCASHVFVTLEAKYLTLQSHMVLYLRLINFEAAKQLCQAIIAVLIVLRHGLQPILLHNYTIV